MKNSLIILIVIILLGLGGYFAFWKKGADLNTGTNTSTTTPVGTTPISTTTIIYKNTEYGFNLTLPIGWKGYSVIEDEWEGYSLEAQTPEGQQVITQRGPLLSVRHPDWEYKSPRQDVPVMVFTLQQWNNMQAEKFHIGAAPINPSELGRNSKYVFALPARYNFSYLTGYEEVDKIIRGNNFHAF